MHKSIEPGGATHASRLDGSETTRMSAAAGSGG
jgi:hypothetical protein